MCAQCEDVCAFMRESIVCVFVHVQRKYKCVCVCVCVCVMRACATVRHAIHHTRYANEYQYYMFQMCMHGIHFVHHNVRACTMCVLHELGADAEGGGGLR